MDNFTLKRPKVNGEFESVLSNHLGKAQYTMAIDQMENYDFVLEGGSVKIPKKTDNVIKSNKCNQCNYASSRAGNLRKHLKTHSGEKSNKCNQCGFTSAEEGALRKRLKTHSENECNNAFSNNVKVPHGLIK